MLVFNDNYIRFNGMGLFETTSSWIHPSITEVTYEIIYVVSGTIFIEENNILYELEKGDMIILKPGVNHKGYKASEGKTSFYWVHFFIKNMEILTNGKFLFSGIKQDYIFREMLHCAHKANAFSVMTELLLTQLLMNNSQTLGDENQKKLTKDIIEWVRINSSPKLKITEIARNFRYSVDHLSRLMKTEYGKNMKQIVTDFVVEKAKGLLVNTNLSIKEIGASLEFTDTNTFLHFFKYHTGKTPSEYRNSFYLTHMNKK